MSVLKTYGMGAEDDFHPSLTYRISGNRIQGKIDGLDAVKQAVDLLLSTERYEYVIYSWDYGSETKDMIGHSRQYIQGDLERRISEALEQDDRVTGIADFALTFSGETATASFTVKTEFGDFEQEVTVNNGR